VMGCVLGPLTYWFDADSSLLVTGLVAGSLGYWVDRRWLRKPQIASGAR
jgi:hypothetical protein